MHFMNNKVFHGKLSNFRFPNSPSVAAQLWSGGCVVSAVCVFQDIAKVWCVTNIFSTFKRAYLLDKKNARNILVS